MGDDSGLRLNLHTGEGHGEGQGEGRPKTVLEHNMERQREEVSSLDIRWLS